MIDLTNRSYKKELLDRDDIPFTDIRQNMKELNTINSFLGGHKITIAGILALVSQNQPGKTVTVCEIGCGGGDNLKAIQDHFNKINRPANFIGIDIKPECIAFAEKQYPQLQAHWITADYKQAGLPGMKPDIIFASLFCHHFTEEEIIQMLLWMKENASLGFFINDLHRHPLAYYSIKWITALFSGSYLVKNDAPLSVARGFKKEEWKKIFHRAGIKHFTIQWKWAFRYLITCSHD